MVSSRKLSSDTHLNTLITSLIKVVSTGLVSAQKALEYQRVKTYWSVGRDMIRYAKKSKGEIVLGQKLYAEISKEIEKQLGINLSPDQIQRCVQFFKVYPKFPTRTPLAFTHYLALMRVSDVKERERLEQEAITRAIPLLELKKEVLLLNSKGTRFPKKEAQKLSVERGDTYLYHLRRYEDLTHQSHMCVDCGFKIHMPLTSRLLKHNVTEATQINHVVRSVKKDGLYQLWIKNTGAKMTYTYGAHIYRVVDGDTLDALIDVGFDKLVNLRMRLKAINTPEIKTAGGLRAKKFLEKYFKKHPIVVIRTFKTGMYGRWLADVFAKEGSDDPSVIAAEGEYLNQVMLDKGLAELY